MTRADEAHLPDRIGPYETTGVLGRGGMGIVYSAIDPQLERPIAIKVLSEELSRNKEWNDRFTREAKILASLNHPNIATIYSLERDGSMEFLTMELIRGRSLAAVIGSGSLAIPDALSIGRQIARALETAHEAGVIHRDLKPLNVMINSDSYVKVLDFGLARLVGDHRTAPGGFDDVETMNMDNGDTQLVSELGDRSQGSERTATSQAGTPGYMSPEQARGDELDARVDVWAFGCVLYECLAGSRAFEGATPLEQLRASLEESPDLDQLPDRIPGSVRQLVESCLRRDPAARLGSLTEARECLESALAERLWESTFGLTEELPGLDASPNNLPNQITPFIGRTEEVARATELFERGGLVTLAGVGGGGKTRLAIRIGEEVLSRFPDGVWIVELASVSDPATLASAVARVLSISEQSGQSIEQTVIEYMRDRSLLLILDNCEHVIDAVAELVASLMTRSDGLRVLATSRETIGISNEMIIQVAPFEVATAGSLDHEALLETDAVRLFVQRATLIRPGFSASAENVGAILEICRRLDGIPLAIELAAARVRTLSLPDILNRLDDRFRLLRGSARQALPHHQTLEALVDWSHAHLTENEQVLFRRLSIFRGGWTLEAAEAICADEVLEEWEILDILTRLIDKSLVGFGSARYGMLETVREYAAKRRLASDESDPIEPRFRDYFSEFVAKAAEQLTGPEQPDWLVRIDSDIGNIRQAMGDAIDRGDSENAIRLSTASLRYWMIRGLNREGLRFLEGALALPRSDEPDGQVGAAFNALGSCHYQLQNLEAAARNYEEAARIMRVAGEPERAAAPLMNLGNVYRVQGDFDRADLSYRESLDLVGESDSWMIAAAQTNLGSIALGRERFEEAGDFYRAALDLLRKVGDRVHEGIALMSLGLVAYETKQFRESLAFLEQSIEIFEELGDRNIGVTALTNLGLTQMALDDDPKSREAFSRALRIAHETGALENVASCLEGFAELAKRQSGFELTITLSSAADAIRVESVVPRVPSAQRAWDEDMGFLRQEVGDEAFEKRWDEGRTLSREAAVALALEEPVGE